LAGVGAPASAADHVLHGQPQRTVRDPGRHRRGLEVAQQRRAAVPVHALGALDDVVALERRDRPAGHLGHLQPRHPGAEVRADAAERILVVADQVHLVDGQHDARDPQQPGDRRVAAAVREQPLGVDEHHGEVGRRGAGDHVARVLRMPRRVGDDEPPPRRLEVPVGDVDRDALLALGAQPVGEAGEVDLRVGDLVRHQRLGVVEQAADQRGLAVVDRAGGREAQQLRHGAVRGARGAGGRPGGRGHGCSPAIH